MFVLFVSSFCFSRRINTNDVAAGCRSCRGHPEPAALHVTSRYVRVRSGPPPGPGEAAEPQQASRLLTYRTFSQSNTTRRRSGVVKRFNSSSGLHVQISIKSEHFTLGMYILQHGVDRRRAEGRYKMFTSSSPSSPSRSSSSNKQEAH